MGAGAGAELWVRFTGAKHACRELSADTRRAAGAAQHDWQEQAMSLMQTEARTQHENESITPSSPPHSRVGLSVVEECLDDHAEADEVDEGQEVPEERHEVRELVNHREVGVNSPRRVLCQWLGRCQQRDVSLRVEETKMFGPIAASVSIWHRGATRDRPCMALSGLQHELEIPHAVKDNEVRTVQTVNSPQKKSMR